MKYMPSGDGGILLYRQRCRWDSGESVSRRRSDKRGDRKSLIVFAACLGVLACTLLLESQLLCFAIRWRLS